MFHVPKLFFAAILAMAVLGITLLQPLHAEDLPVFELTLQNDAFVPADLKVPAGKPFILKVLNKEKSAVEIEAKDLKIEKVIASGGDIIARVKSLKPGRYLLVNEYKEDTVKTYIVAE